MTPYEAPLLGTVIEGKYAVERLIGAGGMGAVYAASQVSLGRKVALKVIHPELCGDPSFIKRFHREASLAASIGHDNICEVTDFGFDPSGMPYLVMPLLKGVSFRDILDEGEIERNRLCDIMRQVLSALDAAHIAGVVHRDLKPDNIFVAKLGDRKDFVKLLDFGISKVLESDSAKKLTQTGTLLGTPDYMAPEQARGDKNVDHRLDIYAAGVILYEALTGSRPYEGASFNEILLKIVTTEYPPPSRIRPDIPKAIEAVILKAMARIPADRYVGAREMSDAMDSAFSAVQPRSAPVPHAAPAAVKTVPRQSIRPVTAPKKRRKTAAAVGVILLAICGAVIWAATHFGEPKTNAAALKPLPDGSFGAVTVPASGNLEPAPTLPTPTPAPSVSPTADNLTPAPTLQPMPEPEAAEPSPETKPKKKPQKAPVEAPSPEPQPEPVPQPENPAPEPAPQPPLIPPPDSPPPPPPPIPQPDPTLPPSVSPTPSPDAAVYTDMSQLKSALREGKITRQDYKTHQAKIRKLRAAEYESIKADYRSGAITRDEYEKKIREVRLKYEGE